MTEINWRRFLPRNKRLKQLHQSIVADNEFPMPPGEKMAPEVFTLMILWGYICGMNPGKGREDLQKKIKGIVESALSANDLAHLKNDPDYQYFIRLIDFTLTPATCPDCGKQVHIGWQPYVGGFDNRGYYAIFPVNESSREMLPVNWKEKDISQLPSGYHLNNCPFCGKIEILDFDHPETLPAEENPFRFLQEFTMIRPGGERLSFADAPAAPSTFTPPLAFTLDDFAHGMSKEDLANKILHFKNLSGVAIRNEMESLSDGEILALANCPKASALVLESAFVVFKHREHWCEKLMFAYRNGLLTIRDAKMYMLHYLNVRGNRYPDDLSFYLELLNDKSLDIIGEALVAVVFFNEKSVIPKLKEFRDAGWEIGSEGYFTLSKAILALERGNPYLAYPYSKDCDNRWGMLALWEHREDYTELLAPLYAESTDNPKRSYGGLKGRK